MNKPAFILDPSQHITLSFDDGLMETIYATDERFESLLDAIKYEDWDLVRNIVTKTAVTIKEAIVETTEKTGERVYIEHGVVYVDDMPMHTTLTDRMMTMLEAGFNIDPMIQFLKNLASNPSFRAVHELYDFMEASSLPITDDGHFLAYKKIKSDWTDCHTGTMDNSIGATVQMPRYMVDDNRNSTCSSGLHFCSRNYLGHFSGNRVVVVKINPADVVSIPADYNDSKGRACKYVVIQELKDVDNTPLEKMPAAVEHEPARTVIQQLDGDGEVIKIYDTIELAAEDTGIRAEYIQRVLDGGRKSTGGFGWKSHTTEAIGYDLSSATYSTEEWEEDDFDEDEDEDDGYNW